MKTPTLFASTLPKPHEPTLQSKLCQRTCKASVKIEKYWNKNKSEVHLNSALNMVKLSWLCYDLLQIKLIVIFNIKHEVLFIQKIT